MIREAKTGEQFRFFAMPKDGSTYRKFEAHSVSQEGLSLHADFGISDGAFINLMMDAGAEMIFGVEFVHGVRVKFPGFFANYKPSQCGTILHTEICITDELEIFL